MVIDDILSSSHSMPLDPVEIPPASGLVAWIHSFAVMPTLARAVTQRDLSSASETRYLFNI